MTYRRPWYWLLVLAFVALGATLLVAEAARTRVETNNREFATAQQLRLQRVEQRLDASFGQAEHLATLMNWTIGHVYNDRGLTSWLTLEIYRGNGNPEFYGVGTAWAPYRFEDGSEFAFVYAKAIDRHFERYSRKATSHASLVQIYDNDAAAYDYTKRAWYRRAVALRGKIAYSGPYNADDVSFVSISRAFYRGPGTGQGVTSTNPEVGPLAGVVTVDILTSQLLQMLRGGLRPGDVAWMTGPDGRRVLATAIAPSAEGQERTVALRYPGAVLHLSSDTRALRNANGTVAAGSIVLVVVLWGLCGVLAVVLMQRRRQREATLALEHEQARLAQEIAISKSVEAELRKTAFTDALTGLPNRAAFMECAAGVLAASDRDAHSVLLADLDRFNVVNETLGHMAGDELLRVLAHRISAHLDAEVFFGRLGGDEYVFVAPQYGAQSERLARAIMELVREPVMLGGQALYMEASIGIVRVDPSYASADELLRDADIAVYRAKNGGRRRFEFFDTAMRAEVARDAELEADLRRAIERGEFIPYYQPILEIESGAIASFEALARWQTPQGIVGAAAFIPFAERRGLAHAIDAQILRKVCSQAATIAGLFPTCSIAVNASAAELGSRELPATIERLLNEFDLSAMRIRLEITETVMMAHADDVRATLERLQELGIALLLDDFGTGYSSLAYLQRLPIVGLKIDKSFVEHLPRDERALEIVRSVVALADAFGLETTAEGVETEQQLDVLRQLGVTYAQGFLFSPAVGIGDLASLPQARPSTSSG